jgi:hypothetical protein
MLRNIYAKFRMLHSLILSFLLLSCLTSCYPFSKNPLPLPSELKADPNILGTWFMTSKSGSKTQMSIFQRNNGWIDVVSIENIDDEKSANGITVSVMEGYNTAVNEQKFLCLRLRKRDFANSDVNEAGEIPFLIVNYETPNNNELNVKLFSYEKVKRLITRDKLKGEIIKEDVLKNSLLEILFRMKPVDIEGVLITASSDELKEAISKEGIKVFLATSSDEIAKSLVSAGVGAFVGQDEIYVLTYSRTKPAEITKN